MTDKKDEKKDEKKPEENKQPTGMSYKEIIDMLVKRMDQIDEAIVNIRGSLKDMSDFLKDKVVPTMNKHTEAINAIVQAKEAEAGAAPPMVEQQAAPQQQGGAPLEAVLENMARGGASGNGVIDLLVDVFRKATAPPPTNDVIFGKQILPELEKQMFETMIMERQNNIAIGQAVIDKIKKGAADEVSKIVKGVLSE